jgi:hypothetical protein
MMGSVPDGPRPLQSHTAASGPPPVLVDTDLAELVFDDGDALAVVVREDAVEQRGLARPQEPGEDGHGHA